MQHRNRLEKAFNQDKENNSFSITLERPTKKALASVGDEVTRINFERIPGFHLRLGKIKANGSRTKTFYLYYRTKGQPVRSVNFRIGSLPEIDIETAENLALECFSKVRRGIDVQAEKENLAKGSSETVVDLYEKFFRYQVSNRRKRPEIVQASFAKDILPRLGEVAVSNVNRALIFNEVISPIMDRGAYKQAGKTVALLKQFFSFAVSCGDIEQNPMSEVKKSDYSGKYKPRTRTPTIDELKETVKTLTSTGMSIQNLNCFKVLLLSGVRSSSAISAEWSEIDFENNLWKAKDEKNSPAGEVVYHSVPMSNELVKVFRDQANLTSQLNSSFVFPKKRKISASDSKDGHMDLKTLNRCLKRIKDNFVIPDFIPHDIRRAIRSYLISVKNTAGNGRYVMFSVACVEKILGHSLKGMSQVYDQHDYLDERRTALEYWGGLFKEVV